MAEGDNVINEFIKSRFVVREVFAIDASKINYDVTSLISFNELKKITSFKNPANSLAVIEKKILILILIKFCPQKSRIF